VEIVLVTRQGCRLCDEALAMLRSLGVDPLLRDVDADEQLHSQYDWRVPVVLLDGRVVAEGRIEATSLAAAIQRV
jgi:predicted thioredoxin/glutaredoxin